MVDKFNDPDSGNPQPVADDPYAELFADCVTVEDIVQLQHEIDIAENAAK